MSSTLYSKRYKPKFGRNRKPRPKTFASEEAAKRWAASHKCDCEVVPASKKGRFSLKC